AELPGEAPEVRWKTMSPQPGSFLGRAALPSRPDGSGEAPYSTTLPAGGTEVRAQEFEVSEEARTSSPTPGPGRLESTGDSTAGNEAVATRQGDHWTELLVSLLVGVSSLVLWAFSSGPYAAGRPGRLGNARHKRKRPV